MVSPVASSGGRKNASSIPMAVYQVATYGRNVLPEFPFMHPTMSIVLSLIVPESGVHDMDWMLYFSFRLWYMKVPYTSRFRRSGGHEKSAYYSCFFVTVRLIFRTHPGGEQL